MTEGLIKNSDILLSEIYGLCSITLARQGWGRSNYQAQMRESISKTTISITAKSTWLFAVMAIQRKVH